MIAIVLAATLLSAEPETPNSYVNSDISLFSAGAAGGVRLAPEGFAGTVEAFVGGSYWHYIDPGGSAITFTGQLHGLFSGFRRAGPGATLGFGYMPASNTPAWQLDLGAFTDASPSLRVLPAVGLNIGLQVVFFRLLGIWRDGYEVHLMFGVDVGEALSLMRFLRGC
ncbi:MAG: hypothetical protein ACJ790_18905 [Myxococcaceae bacterium]